MSASVSIARRRLAGAPDSRFIPTLAWAVAGALVLGAALIMADTLRWVYRAYSPLPWWDQWETISGYMRIRAGGSWWHELVRPHNEHRLVVPRLFFLADLALLGGQNRLLLPMCAGIQLYHAGLLVWLGHRSSSGHSQWTNPVFIASSALAIALLFSFAQMENLFWAFQIAFLGVFAAATTSFLLLTRAVWRQQAGRGWQLSLFAGLALIPIASFTMANGVLAGPIAILLLLALRARWLWIVAAVATSALSLAFFFKGFAAEAGGQGGAVMTLFQHPVLAFRYVATFLGGPFGPAFLNDALYPFQAAGCLAIGAVGIVLTAITLTHIALRRGPASYLVALGAVILFAGASAAVTSAGRMDYFGVGQALSSRYATPAAIFWAALLLYWAGVSSQQASPRKALLLAWMIGAPLLFVPLWVGERQMKPVVMDWVAKVNLGADALLSNVYDPEALAGVTMKPSLMAGWAHFLAKRQLSIFRLDEAAWLNRPLDHVARLTSSRACAGRFETVHNGAELTGDQLRASGWAWDRRNAREATRIVLTAADLKVRGFATADFPRLELPRRHPAVRTARAGWQGFVRGRNGETLRAFAILPGKQACEIGVRRIHGVTRQAALGQLAPEQVGNILSANASGEGYFVPDDFPKTAGLAPGPAYGSYAANGAATGAILFGPSVARGREIAFAIVTGADAQKVKVQLVDPASDEVLAEVAPAPRTTWTWVSLPVEPGRPFKLVARDNNPEPGEWIGMTSPYEVRR